MSEQLFALAIISTGGTIEKTYDEAEGILSNGLTVLDLILERLQLEGLKISRVQLMNKDSRELTEEDRESIAEAVNACASKHDGVVVVHGTDTLSVTGECIEANYPNLPVPCVLTGAMRPWIMRNTDSMQNLSESFAVVQLLDPGVYVAMHSQVLKFPGVVKNIEQMRFVRREAQ
ncbi:MAG: asparaginase domain-containing protein [Phycisphaerales bacterium]|jgi:L-asparaginase|nr:asparaginase domain-containing protein [Phycisphaerales bacterium]